MRINITIHKQLINFLFLHRFLQRSLFSLKEKYAKFTPLIFLTNFVFANQKFNQRLEQEQQGSNVDSTLIEQVTHVMQSKLAPNEENSQQLIKLIKSETQCKLLEQRCESLQSKLKELQQELCELRLQHATESEHWQTIEALFSEPSSEHHKETVGVDASTNTIATPTAAAAAPVPAVRRAAQLIDKQSSPIGSPRRRVSIQHMAIQTSETTVQLQEMAVQTTNGTTSGSQAQQAHQAVQTSQDTSSSTNEELQQLRTK